MVDSGIYIILLLGLALIVVSSPARSTIDRRIEHKLDLLLKHAAIDLNAAIDNEVERLIKEGQKQTAVTYYHELTGAKKKEASQHVDDIEMRLLEAKLQS